MSTGPGGPITKHSIWEIILLLIVVIWAMAHFIAVERGCC